MKNRLFGAGVLALCLFISLAGCSGAAVQTADVSLGEVSIREAVIVASPQDAVAEVYAALPDARVEALDIAKFYSLFPDLTGLVYSYYGCVSDVNGGLADLMLLAPKEGERETVRNALLSYQEARIKEFESYDILDAFEIAKAALVYDQGDYIILTMLPDNEAAQNIIDLHIPL